MSTWPCCRHCAPANPHHPATPDAHTTPCGCERDDPQLDLFAAS